MAKEANFGFLAIFSGVSHASQSYSQVFRPCFSAVFPGLVFPDMSPGGWPCSRGWQEAQPCTERLLMNCAPCITRLFSGHLACPVPEKGASGTEYLLRTGKACFLHRMLHHLDHFCRSYDEWLDGEVLDISCHEVGVFFGKSHFVEYDVFRIWEIDAFS